jgi:hypothetical protein
MFAVVQFEYFRGKMWLEVLVTIVEFGKRVDSHSSAPFRNRKKNSRRSSRRRWKTAESKQDLGLIGILQGAPQHWLQIDMITRAAAN